MSSKLEEYTSSHYTNYQASTMKKAHINNIPGIESVIVEQQRRVFIKFFAV
ncbi:MAG: hypothetical protein M3044_12480 [Thermoproteota archaeon]|nr:hypothetical protein [Thermoproteota archaeon]